jgi:hypothetical protein
MTTPRCDHGVAAGANASGCCQRELERCQPPAQQQRINDAYVRQAAQGISMKRHGFDAVSLRVREDDVMPKKINPELKAWAVRMVQDH